MTEIVTLIAACIAAISSLGLVIIKITAQQESEARGAHRNLLSNYVERLGEALHEVMACSHISLKAKSDESKDKWKQSADRAKEVLKEIRTKLRYPLWGLDDGIKTMTLVSDWVMHYKEDSSKATEFLNMADGLRLAIDNAVRISYSSGCPPTKWQIYKVNNARKKLIEYHDETLPNK